jgi:hypothetical protein
MLVRKGWSVEVVERGHFPRFSIGESLLPQSMVFLEEAGLLADIEAIGFQFKDGAAFHKQGVDTAIYFPDKSTPGPATTFQVRRDIFDERANGAQQGAFRVRRSDRLESSDAGAAVTVRNEQGAAHQQFDSHSHASGSVARSVGCSTSRSVGFDAALGVLSRARSHHRTDVRSQQNSISVNPNNPRSGTGSSCCTMAFVRRRRGRRR